MKDAKIRPRGSGGEVVLRVEVRAGVQKKTNKYIDPVGSVSRMCEMRCEMSRVERRRLVTYLQRNRMRGLR